MQTCQLRTSEAISTGWDYAKRYGLLIAVIYLLITVVSTVLQNLTGMSIDENAIQEINRAIERNDSEAILRIIEAANSGAGAVIAQIFTSILQLVITVGLYNLALGLVDGRYTSVNFDAFKLPASVYVKVVIVQIITGIIIALSLLFCVVPFFFVAPRLAFAYYYAIENPQAGIMESIKASWQMTSGNLLSLIGMGFAFMGIILVGYLCCCVGVYFAEVIVLFATIAAYHQLKGNLQ